MEITKSSIILFDGHCNLCNKWVQTIIKWDKQEHFKFASLQSVTGKSLVKKFKLQNYDSIVLVKGEEVNIESEAAFEILKKLSGPRRFLLIFSLLPKSISDWAYRLIAKNRFRMFGRKETCMVPTEEVKSRFLDY